MNAKQLGATTLEFLMMLLLFLTFFLGITDFARMLFTWGAATEATRHGARFAAICDDTGNAEKVLARMRGIVPEIESIDLAWEPSGCTPANCQSVTVTITSLDYRWISPIAGIASAPVISMPTFSTTLPREIMKQDPVAAPFACA